MSKIKKVKLMDKIEQMIILDAPKYMINDVVQVYEDTTGLRTGKIKVTKTPIVWDKVSHVWRLAA